MNETIFGGILGFEFMQNAILAALLSSIACGIIGTFVVVKELASSAGGLHIRHSVALA